MRSNYNLFYLLTVSLTMTLAGCGTVKEIKQGPDIDQILVQKAEGGEVSAQYSLGQRYARGSIPKTNKAIYWFCRASTQGHIQSQLALAQLYQRRGRSSTRSVTEGRLSDVGSAYFWYTAAAAQGNEQAFGARENLARKMSKDEILGVKRQATRWRKAKCVAP